MVHFGSRAFLPGFRKKSGNGNIGWLKIKPNHESYIAFKKSYANLRSTNKNLLSKEKLNYFID